MKITIITVVYNAEKTLRNCIESVLMQNYRDIEYILVDGKSTDGSFNIAQEYAGQIDVLLSENDKGMYDALNKGINLASGEVVGILNADDMLASADVIAKIAGAFQQSTAGAVYGNLHYVAKENPSQIVRRWKSRATKPKDLAMGWMPAHPTLYLKKKYFKQFGNYKLDFGSAADYELMLRFLYVNQISTFFLDELLVNMRVGGMSNQSLGHRWNALINDWKALKVNRIPAPLIALLFKKLTKVKQFLR